MVVAHGAEEGEGAVPFDFDARFAHVGEVSIAPVAGAKRVEDEVDFDAALGGFVKGFTELINGPRAARDEGFKGDAMLGVFDGLEHDGKKFIAVVECFNMVALRPRGFAHGSEFGGELLGVNGGWVRADRLKPLE